MDRAESIIETARQLYESILEPDCWHLGMQSIIAAVSGDQGVLMMENLRTGSAEAAIGCGMSADMAAAYVPAYSQSAVMGTYRGAISAGRAFAASDIVPNEIFARSAFYNETVRPCGLFHAALAIPQYDRHRRATLAIGRTLGREDYSARTVEMLQVLVPHLTTALRLRQEFGDASLLARDAQEILHRLDVGVILVDAGMHPGFVNRRARTIADEADGLSIGPDAVATARPEQTRKLQRAVAAMAAVASPLSPSDTVDTLVGSATDAAAARLRIARPSSRPPLSVVVVPLCGTRYRDVWQASYPVALLISEPDKPPRIDATALAETYGLAPREAQVALLLAQGLDPRAIAAALDIGVGTAREHLKRALAKTETRRQANLVRLVLRDFTMPLR